MVCLSSPEIAQCRFLGPAPDRDYLAAVEEEYKRRKEERKADMFGSKIQATQTESAFGVRVM